MTLFPVNLPSVGWVTCYPRVLPVESQRCVTSNAPYVPTRFPLLEKTDTIAPHIPQGTLSTASRPHLVHVLTRDIPFILNITFSVLLRIR